MTQVVQHQPRKGSMAERRVVPSPRHGAQRATVTRGGTIGQIEDGAGARFLERHPDIVRYAVNLIDSGQDATRFIFIGPDKVWHKVRIEVEPLADGEMSATVIVRTSMPPFGMTPRELDVVTLISGGLSNQQIAEKLSARLRTITTHVEHVLEKLGLANRAGLAGMAAEFGLLRLPVPGNVTLSSLSLGLVDCRRITRPSPARSERVEKRPIIIGAPLSLSGFSSADAREMLNGATLAIEQINARGGVCGRRIELQVVDCDINDPASVNNAYTTMIDAEVDAITGGYTCVEDRVHDLVADYGAPYLHCVTMEAVVERVRQDPGRLRNIFQTGPTDIHYGPRFIDFVRQIAESGQWQPRNRRILVIQPSWSHMDIGLETMEIVASRHGWTIDTLLGLPLSGIDWSAVMDKVHACDPAIILLAYYFPEESIAFQQTFLGTPLDSLVYLLYGPSVPQFRDTLGPAAEGVIWATTTGTYSDGLARTFADGYAQRHGRAPGRAHAGLAYDRVNLLASAWARAGNPRDFNHVIGALRRSIHRGVSGAYWFDNPGQCGQSYSDMSGDPSLSQAHLIFQIQNGKDRILTPHLYGDGQFRLPPWFSGGR